ncbi:MAG: sulfite exporter TauE/SafE family protein [Chloroflexi bacterium]|nr:sulfite exporter TauE/SafE family protein [Chloroflexota bacterium]
MPYAVAILLATLLIGLSKGGLGGPVPVALVTPILVTVMPAGEAVGIVLPLLMVADVFALWVYWKRWDTQQVKLLLPMAVLGVAMGSLLLASLAQHDLLFRRILGAFTLLVILYKIGSERLRTVQYQPQRWHGWLVGWLSGFASALANVGAPPFTAYMLLQNVSPVVFIANTTLLFAIVNALKLPGVLLAGVLDWQHFTGILWALPLIPPSIWFGRKFVGWVNPRVFEQIMIVLLFFASIALLLSQPK